MTVIGRITGSNPAKKAYKMINLSGIKLETTDNFIEKITRMYPNRSNGAMTKAEKTAAVQKRADCRAAFTSDEKPITRIIALLTGGKNTSLKEQANLYMSKSEPFMEALSKFASKLV